VVSLLLKDGKATSDLANKKGITALSSASQQGHDKVVSLLLQDGKATPDLAAKNGVTPLHSACFRGHRKIVRRLLLVIGRELSEDEMNNLDQLVPPHARAMLKLRQCSSCKRMQKIGETPFKKCSRCLGSVRYCSKECQQAAWKLHKSSCVAKKK
jgi:ankyrin repeat protein